MGLTPSNYYRTISDHLFGGSMKKEVIRYIQSIKNETVQGLLILAMLDSLFSKGHRQLTLTDHKSPIKDRAYYCQVLGVNSNASPLEIRQAYRKAALQLHHDRTTDPSKRDTWPQILEAYEILTGRATRTVSPAQPRRLTPRYNTLFETFFEVMMRAGQKYYTEFCNPHEEILAAHSSMPNPIMSKPMTPDAMLAYCVGAYYPNFLGMDPSTSSSSMGWAYYATFLGIDPSTSSSYSAQPLPMAALQAQGLNAAHRRRPYSTDKQTDATYDRPPARHF